jgi:hypothetical protein
MEAGWSSCPRHCYCAPAQIVGRAIATASSAKRFIATAMDLAMMHATERHHKLITDLATERTPLREAQMVWI